MRRPALTLVLAGLCSAVALALIIPLPVPYRLVYPNSPLYTPAFLAVLGWQWFKDRAGLRILLASIVIFELLRLALFTALPSFVLKPPDVLFRCGFMLTGFTALDQHSSGPSEFFGFVAILWAAAFAGNRPLAARSVSAGAFICLERAPVPLGFFLLHGALGAGLAGVALLMGARIERVHGALPSLPLPLAVLLAAAVTFAVMMATGPYQAPAIDLLIASALSVAWLGVVFGIPNARPRLTAAMHGWV